MVDEQITDHCLSTAAANEADPVPIIKLVVDESCLRKRCTMLCYHQVPRRHALDAAASILG